MRSIEFTEENNLELHFENDSIGGIFFKDDQTFRIWHDKGELGDLELTLDEVCELAKLRL